MLNTKEKSLPLALTAAACQELPKAVTEDAEGTFWTKAIILVKKCNGTQNYCLAERRSDGLIIYKRDFGDRPSPIFGLISVHPYIVVDLKRFGHGTLEDFKEYMRKSLNMTDEDMAANSEEDWKRARVEYAMREQEESDRRFQLSGVMEDETVEEVEAVSTREDTVADGVIQTEDGGEETFKVLSSSKTNTKKRSYKKTKK